MKIGIICGHGNGDPGAISPTFGSEADFVRKLAPLIKNYLSEYAEVNIFDTSIIWYSYLQSNYFDFSEYDYIIELHCNAGAKNNGGNGKTTGIEVWVTSLEQAITVEQKICKALQQFGLFNRGVKVCDFLVITAVKKQGVSSCLIENGFIDDFDDMKLISDNIEEYCKVLAKAIAEGFGLKLTEDHNAENSEEYVIQCGVFKEYTNAKRISDKINSIGYSNRISKINDYHKVYVGPFKKYETASEVSEKLNKNEIDNYVYLEK